MLTYQNTQTIKGGQPNIHVKKDNNEVCVYLDQEKAEDYAKTIKAIPQMLEALKELVNAADFKMGKKAFELIIEMAINAIELAEGRIE